jgi:hypothetical protein
LPISKKRIGPHTDETISDGAKGEQNAMPGQGRRFQKGQPGGPGRPKLEFLERMRKRSGKAEAIIDEALKSKSKAERRWAAEQVFDRGWGRPKQTTELTGEEGKPVEFVVTDPKFKV